MNEIFFSPNQLLYIDDSRHQLYRWVIFRWMITLECKQRRMQHMCLTQQGGMQWSASGKRSARLWRDLQTHWWCTAETMGKRWWPSGLWSMQWKLFIFSLIRTQFKSLSMLSSIGIKVALLTLSIFFCIYLGTRCLFFNFLWWWSMWLIDEF